jgi:hypothetical protein
MIEQNPEGAIQFPAQNPAAEPQPDVMTEGKYRKMHLDTSIALAERRMVIAQISAEMAQMEYSLSCAMRELTDAAPAK